jgi:hypothetical protein
MINTWSMLTSCYKRSMQLPSSITLTSRILLTVLAEFSLQRMRLALWGESVGLIPNLQNGKRLDYDLNISRSVVQPGVDQILNSIRLILAEAGRGDDKDGLKSDTLKGFSLFMAKAMSHSKGMQVFKRPFNQMKSRIKRNQRQASTWKVTKWTIYDMERFEAMIDRLEEFVDQLGSTTKSSAQLRGEINKISDVESLRLLREVISGRSSYKDVFDTVSRRLASVERFNSANNPSFDMMGITTKPSGGGGTA